MLNRLLPVVIATLGSLLLVACGSSTTSHDSASTSGNSAGNSVSAASGSSTPVPNGALLDAATKAAVDFGTYDYKTIKQTGWKFLDDLTSTYKAGYAGQSDQFISSLITGQSTSTATVLSTSLTSQTDTKAVVLVTIAQKLTGTGNPMNTTTGLQMTLLKQTNGTWLVDGATIPQGPQS